jgi:hypothetical protein
VSAVTFQQQHSTSRKKGQIWQWRVSALKKNDDVLQPHELNSSKVLRRLRKEKERQGREKGPRRVSPSAAICQTANNRKDVTSTAARCSDVCKKKGWGQGCQSFSCQEHCARHQQLLLLTPFHAHVRARWTVHHDHMCACLPPADTFPHSRTISVCTPHLPR